MNGFALNNMARYGIRPLDGTHESYASTLREGVSNGRIKASGLEVEAEYVMAASDTNTRDFGWVLGVGLVLVGAPILGYLAAERPMLALVVLGGSAAVVALINRPVWGVYGLLIGTAFDSVSISAGFAILGAGDLSCLLMLPMWLLHRLIHVSEMRWPIGLQYLIAFFVLSFASMMFGVDPSIAQGGFVRLVIYGVTVVAVVDLLRTGEATDRALLILAVCSLIHAVVALGMGAGATIDSVDS